MFSDHLLIGDPVFHPDGSFEQQIRLNWYRSLPVSCIEAVGLTIDGRDVPPERVSLVVDGVTVPSSRLAASDAQWFVQDAAILLVEADGRDGRTAADRVGVTMRTRIPYVIVGDGGALLQTDTQEKVLKP